MSALPASALSTSIAMIAGLSGVLPLRSIPLFDGEVLLVDANTCKGAPADEDDPRPISVELFCLNSPSTCISPIT